MKNWHGQRVLILGAARQGLALARFLARHGAVVTINDQRSAEQLQSTQQALADLPVRWALGGHPLELLDSTDLVCLSGGVPPTLPIVVEAVQRGLPLSNDSQIFMEAVPCRVIAITGSAGKTTTTTLVGRMAQAVFHPPYRAWIGGNIGLPLVDYLEEIQPDDVVVLELSSFQLEQMTRSPQIAAILNITPNHLDRHGTFEAYKAAKARLLEFQSLSDMAVLGRDDVEAWSLAQMAKGGVFSFGLNRPAKGSSGTFLKGELLAIQTSEGDVDLFPRSLIELRGEHNLMNVLGACAIANVADFPVSAMAAAIAGFKGVAHRLEFVRTYHGAAWYNDSIATAPERTEADIRAFNQPIVLLLGGRDKNLPWERLAELIHQRVDHVIVFGEASEIILRALGKQETGRRPYTLSQFASMELAIEEAARIAETGDVVLLSPGGTSFDQYKDFEERGERYRACVNQLS